jgi:hypothetical protein
VRCGGKFFDHREHRGITGYTGENAANSIAASRAASSILLQWCCCFIA